MEIVTKSALETEKLGESLANNLKRGSNNPRIICLYGELGSGKTTFTKGFARGLGIKQRILSPTFIIIRRYQITNYQLPITNFYHLDLYRIQSLSDAKSLGLEEILSDTHNIVLIEWPKVIREILSKKRTEIYFRYLKENKQSFSSNERSIKMNFL